MCPGTAEQYFLFSHGIYKLSMGSSFLRLNRWTHELQLQMVPHAYGQPASPKKYGATFLLRMHAGFVRFQAYCFAISLSGKADLRTGDLSKNKLCSRVSVVLQLDINKMI